MGPGLTSAARPRAPAGWRASEAPGRGGVVTVNGGGYVTSTGIKSQVFRLLSQVITGTRTLSPRLGPSPGRDRGGSYSNCRSAGCSVTYYCHRGPWLALRGPRRGPAPGPGGGGRAQRQ